MLTGPTIASVVAISLVTSAALAQPFTPPPAPTPTPADTPPAPPPTDTAAPSPDTAPPPESTPSVSPAGAFAPAYQSGPPPAEPQSPPETQAPEASTTTTVPLEASEPPKAPSLIVDVGLGPALGIGYNRAKYETELAPVDAERPPTWRVVRTEQGLNLDVMVSISAYIWKKRYINDDAFDVMQLAPRPMVGISLDRPFDVLYAGIQLDPIRYVNIAGGARFANDEKLVGPQLLDPALRNAEGEPQPPVTREELRVSGFVALTVSTNLAYEWLENL